MVPTSLWFSVTAVFATGLPIATTISLTGSSDPGLIVVHNEDTGVYQLSSEPQQQSVYGVVVDRPALVLETATTAVPVITQGVALTWVSTAAGEIQRGDVLVTSAAPGIAQRAVDGDRGMFGIALENYTTNTAPGLIWVDIGAERATTRHAQLLQEQATTSDSADEEGGAPFPWVRLVIAAVVALGSLGFVLYSARSIWMSGIQAIGRNPRARGAVWLTAVGGTVLMIVIGVAAILIALGVLVLPV